MIDLDGQLPPDHLARVVWAFVVSVDLSPLYDRIKARDAVAGRPTPDPQVLLALWLYAVLDGVGSARALERLCRWHVAYRWLCGGVPVNYHGLSAFRTLDGALLDRILSESAAVLAAEGLVRLDDVAVDGTKLRASAGKGSFRSGAALVAWEQAARARIDRLKAELADDPGAGERRRRAAQERAAAAIAQRAAAVRAKLAELQAEKAARAKTHKKQEAAKGEPTASTTDAEARLMKLADGGSRPAYNLLLAVAPREMVILGLAPTDRRNDSGLATPMVEQLEQRYGVRPARLLVDTHLATQAEIVALAEHPARPVAVYAPVPAEPATVTPQTARKRAWRRGREPDALMAWRRRMASAAGQILYRQRRLIETVNGQLKTCGLRRLKLRGLAKVRCEALLYAIAHNIRRGHALRLAAAGP
ncbi:MAG TPA: transposase [Alphaproteobacteria bacterium]|nr:transposase [Alphaproteobacteria bacterium]